MPNRTQIKAGTTIALFFKTILFSFMRILNLAAAHAGQEPFTEARDLKNALRLNRNGPKAP